MDLSFILNKNKNKSFDIFKICILALIIRIFYLILIYCFKNELGTHFWMDTIHHDDIMYENCALIYSENAYSLIDKSAFIDACNQVGHYAQFVNVNFWFWFVCIIQYIFKSIYILRIFNIFFGVLTVKYIYKFTYEYFGKHNIAKLSSIMFAILPYPSIFSCFIFKDQLQMLCVIFILYLIVNYINKNKISKIEFVFLIISLIVIKLSRTGLAELLLIIIGINLMFELWKNRRKRKIQIIIFTISIVAILIGIRFYNTILTTFLEKYNAYVINNRYDGSMISIIAINNIFQIYKFPLSYVFAIIQPLNFNAKIIDWSGIVGNLNVIQIPIAVSNIIYLFFIKKKKIVLYFTIMLMYFGTLLLSMGIVRHYYFLYPLPIIYFASFFDEDISKKNKKLLFVILTIGSMLLFLLLFIYYKLL